MSFAQRVKDLVDAGNGELGERAYCVDILVVHRNPDAAVFLRYGDHGDGARRGRVVDDTGSHILIEYGINRLGKHRVGAVGVEGTWNGVRGDGDLEREKGTRTKVTCGRGENVGKLAMDVAQGRND